jgi:putative transcriptional regulator
MPSALLDESPSTTPAKVIALATHEQGRCAGVTRQTIGAIENGQFCPSALLAFVLAQQLEMPITELFFLEGEGHERHESSRRGP